MKPLYAMHKSADDRIISVGSFHYSFEIDKWLTALDLREGDRIEFQALVKREPEVEPEKPLKVVV